MPLTFIKKLAVKLLGKNTEANKPAKKPEQAKKGVAGAPAQQRSHTPPAKPHGPSGRAGEGERRQPGRGERPSGGAARPRPERQGRDMRGAPREGGGAGEGPSSAEKAPSTSRPVARPPSRPHPRGRGFDERPMSDPGSRRPGGAMADEEMAKRRTEHAAWSVDQYLVAPAEGKKRFQDFDLPTEILHAVCDMGFQYCTPIQALSLEHALAGKNVTGKAQTGTGKTAAFLVAILARYLRSPEARQEQGGAPRALVIAPTRELVIQICKDAGALGKYCGLRSLAVYGGMDYERQKREVTDAPVDLLVATPGRLLDFVRSRVVDLSKVDTLVIDEADRMLDMGFIPDVRSIINRLPPKEKRGTMLYSATLTDDVMKLASQWMEAPVRVETECEQVTTKTVKQVVYVVTAREKFTVLYNQIQQYPDSRMLIFCNRRNTTEDVADSLTRRGIRCEMLSGDVNQNRRLRVLEDFREGKVRIVVATDVAGRGLHVDDIGFVINFDFPYEPEDYVHRIGRTGRAGASGTAISFADEDESFIIPDIEKYIGEELKCTVLTHDDPLLTKMPEVPRAPREHREHAERGRGPSDDRRGPSREEPRRQPEAVAAQPHGELLPPAGALPQPEFVPAPEQRERTPERAEKAVAPVQVSQPHVDRQPTERQPAELPKTAPRESHAPRVPSPAVPSPASAATKRPRFSEEWVPGQAPKS